jgi:hypothetical protein
MVPGEEGETMNEVKKLARLLRDMDLWAYNTSFEKQAEFLIANGVTVQRWIPVTERLPEDGEQVLACTKNGRAFSAHYDHFWGEMVGVAHG